MPVSKLIRPRQEPMRESWTVEWTNLTGTDTGVQMSLGDANDKSVQITGALGGGTITIEGSNNGTDWAVLSDPQGNPLVFTSSGKIEAILEAVAFLRPSFTGVTNASVFVFARGQVS
jgi:hypothetical protein